MTGVTSKFVPWVLTNCAPSIYTTKQQGVHIRNCKSAFTCA